MTLVWPLNSLLGKRRGQWFCWTLSMYDTVAQQDCSTAKGEVRAWFPARIKKRRIGTYNVMAVWHLMVTCLVVAVTCQVCTHSIELKFVEDILLKLICDQPVYGYESGVLQWILDIRKILCPPPSSSFATRYQQTCKCYQHSELDVRVRARVIKLDAVCD
jgi:hypothetical protein